MSSEKVRTSWRKSSNGRSIPEICDDGEAQDGYRNEERNFSGLNFANRSWADICDEDSQKTLEPEKDHASLLLQDDSTLGPISTDKESSSDMKGVISSVSSSSEIRIFSSHSGLIKGVFSESETREFRTDMKPTKQGKKRKECELLLNEDSLSLSSHFDVIKMESPRKTTPTKQLRSRSPICYDESTVTSPYRLKRRVPLKESLSDDNQPMDESLPSPSKIPKRKDSSTSHEKSRSTPREKSHSSAREKSHSTPKEKSHSTPKEKEKSKSTSKDHSHSKSRTPRTPRTPRDEKSDKTSKRKRVDSQLDSQPSTPGSGSKQRLEIETDPEVLLRRQKQIDYGKNTSGYERYLELVPRDSRSRDHPKTPPKQLKYSRRAWDGLVRTWRKRLHYWDVPNEDGTMPEYVDDYGSMSEQSSCDESMSVESLPSTPMQEWKRRVRQRHESESSDCSSSMAEDDCHPLAVSNDIKV